MRLVIATPLAVVVDTPDVAHVRAEDDTGSFGILEHHADFLTVLAISVLSWRDGSSVEHYAAVRGGVLSVTGGRTVRVATREAVAGTDLQELETAVLARFREEVGAEQMARTGAARLQIAAIREICRYLRPESARRALPRLSAQEVPE
ncbi:MAG: F0F1 ATP synthase subunit epsilon [Alphaproteobacteria bacterium]